MSALKPDVIPEDEYQAVVKRFRARRDSELEAVRTGPCLVTRLALFISESRRGHAPMALS